MQSVSSRIVSNYKQKWCKTTAMISKMTVYPFVKWNLALKFSFYNMLGMAENTSSRIIFSEYGIKNSWKYLQSKCCLNFFCKISFGDSANSLKLISYGSFSLNTVLIVILYFLNFRSRRSEKKEFYTLKQLLGQIAIVK